MSATASFIRQSQLLGRLVLDRATTETLGHVAALWVDPRAARVLGIVIRSGPLPLNLSLKLPLGGPLRACAWGQVVAIGADSVLVDLGTQGESLQQPEGAFDLVGHEVWTDGGNRIGTVADLELDPAVGRVDRYLFRREGVADVAYSLPAGAAISGGPKRLLVVTQAAEAAEAVPLTAAWDQALDSVQTSVQTTLRQVQEKTKPIAETARSRFADLAREARDRAKSLADTARTRATELTETMRDRADRLTQESQSPQRDRPAGNLPAAPENAATDDDDDPIDLWDEDSPAIDTPASPIKTDSHQPPQPPNA